MIECHARRSHLGSLVFLLASVGTFVNAGCQAAEKPDLPAVAAPYPPSNLDDLLKSRGYGEVALVPYKGGYLDVEVKVNDQPLLFILDTGAGSTTLDRAVAERLKLAIHKTGKALSGLTGSQPEERTQVVKLTLGPNVCDESPIVSDLSAVNMERKKAGTRACDGILGNNILQLVGAVIDLSAPKLYMLELTALLSFPPEVSARAAQSSNLTTGRATGAIVVVLPEPALKTTPPYDQLKVGMSFSQISAVLGGDLKKGRLIPSYTGTLAIIQGKDRIDLVLENGRLSGKSIQKGDGSGTPGISPQGDPTAVIPASSSLDLADFLKARGFIAVPLTVGKDLFFDVAVKVNGEPMRFLLDTGTLPSALDTAVAKRLKLPIKRTDQTFPGITGPKPLENTVVERLSVGSITWREEPSVTDFSALHVTRKTNGLPPWDGALGLDVLELYSALIDYEMAKLYLWGPAEIIYIPEGRDVKWKFDCSTKKGRAVRVIVIELLQTERGLVTQTAYERLKPGMTFAEIAGVFGGPLKNARLAAGYTGMLALVNGQVRIELSFQDSKMTAKSAHGLD